MTGLIDACAPVLVVDNVEAGYGPENTILNGVSLELRQREVICVIGPNGAGKSTLLKVIFGLLPARSGEVRLRGKRVDRLPPHQIVTRKMAYVPQLDNVFPSLSVQENLQMSATMLQRRDVAGRIELMLELFPDLRRARRRASGLLSGGQRQMLAMARALMPEPDVILFDEPSAGLAPKYMEQVFDKIAEINRTGVGVVVVEQNARQALAVSHRGYVLEMGRCRFEGPARGLLADPAIVDMYLGKAHRAGSGGDVASPAVSAAETAQGAHARSPSDGRQGNQGGLS